MDGARFANALVAPDASPAEMTWKRGAVDILSFGGTKNGCFGCRGDRRLQSRQGVAEMPIRKRAAQLFEAVLHRRPVRRRFR